MTARPELRLKDEREEMLARLGLDKGTKFDPHRFELNDVNRGLRLVGATR